MQSGISWDEYFFEMAYFVSTKAKDPSRKTGAVVTRDNVVLMTGFCGFPVGVNDKDPARYERSVKNLNTVHAEANAVAMAARKGVALEGATMYCNLHPCYNCANLMIQAGIKRVVCKKLPPNPTRNDVYRFDLARERFDEVGIEVCEIDDGEEFGQLERRYPDG